jgi:ribokinase
VRIHTCGQPLADGVRVCPSCGRPTPGVVPPPATGPVRDATGRGPHVVVVGSTMMDLVAFTERVPAAGETIVGDAFSTGFGGKGANQAVMARLLGARVSMVACVGDDANGRLVRDELARRGVDVTGVQVRSDAASGVAMIWVEPDGTNRIVILPGANALVDARAAASIAGADAAAVVVGQLEAALDATLEAFAAARRVGATTILNPAPVAPLPPALLAVTDWLVPNEVEFALLSGGGDADDDAALAAFAAATATRLVVTLGDRGAALVGADGTVVRHPARDVDAVDTTGAGDAFVGAFATALASGQDEERAVAVALALASDTVRRPGAQASYPDEASARALWDAVLVD